MSVQSTERMLCSCAHIGIVAPSLGQSCAPMINLFHPQLVLIQTMVDCGQSDLVNVSKMDIVFQESVSDVPLSLYSDT